MSVSQRVFEIRFVWFLVSKSSPELFYGLPTLVTPVSNYTPTGANRAERQRVGLLEVHDGQLKMLHV